MGMRSYTTHNDKARRAANVAADRAAAAAATGTTWTVTDALAAHLDLTGTTVVLYGAITGRPYRVEPLAFRAEANTEHPDSIAEMFFRMVAADEYGDRTCGERHLEADDTFLVVD